ncbi:MAG TPA: response regulator [Burkholderiaceae bacterium]|nr:response regulator [Burkholderiaceae bacterium]
MSPTEVPADSDDFTTLEVAKLLGMSVRSVQLMVDRGELDAWKTSGGHRRIARASVDHWRGARGVARPREREPHPQAPAAGRHSAQPVRPRVLLIDDSIHFQKLVALLIQQRFPEIELHVADDGIAGLALYGQLQPQVLIVDLLLPGIDGATLITSLRSHAQFADSRLAVATSLDEQQRAPYAFALEQVPVIHKPRLVAELSDLLATWLPARGAQDATAAAT